MNKLLKPTLEEIQRQAEAAQFALNEHSLVSMTDIKGNIISVNKKFTDVSGYSEAELIGQNHRLLNSGNQPKDYWREMYLAVSKGKPWHDEVRNTAKDGHHYWVDTTIVPNFDSQHKLIGYTSIRTDITQSKENAAVLEDAQRKTEAAQFALNEHSLVSMTDIKG
ncbi:MAG: PAS domain-containing protein, partial [Colwellia sp.]